MGGIYGGGKGVVMGGWVGMVMGHPVRTPLTHYESEETREMSL